MIEPASLYIALALGMAFVGLLLKAGFVIAGMVKRRRDLREWKAAADARIAEHYGRVPRA